MPSWYLFAGLCNIVVQPCQTGSGREYSIPVFPACHSFQFTTQGLLYSIFFVLLHRSPGRSSPSFQLLVMNPGFFMFCCKGTLFHWNLASHYLLFQYVVFIIQNMTQKIRGYSPKRQTRVLKSIHGRYISWCTQESAWQSWIQKPEYGSQGFTPHWNCQGTDTCACGRMIFRTVVLQNFWRIFLCTRKITKICWKSYCPSNSNHRSFSIDLWFLLFYQHPVLYCRHTRFHR